MNWQSLYILILTIGAVQGFILGASLWRSRGPRRRSNHFLALMLFFLAYRLTAEVLFEANIASINNWSYHILLEYNWVYGPLLYFFTASLSDPAFRLAGRQWLHFLPAGAEFVFSNFIKAQNFFWDGTAESLSWAGYWGYVLWEHTPFQLVVAFCLVLLYAFLSERRLQQENTLKEEEAQWLRRILTLYKAFALLALFTGLVDYLLFDYAFRPFYIFPTYIGMACLTYWLGLQGFARRGQNILFRRRQEELPPEFEALARRLKHLMEEQHAYRDSSLTLAATAAELDIQPYQLTQLLSGHFQQNFNDFVNRYRVEEALRLARDPDYAHLSLMGIAFEAGFNSKATFNRAVKKATGKTPRELRQ